MADYITGVEYTDTEIQEYITSQNIVHYLNEGCIALAKERPQRPLEWLGRWILAHNRKKPVTTEPEDLDAPEAVTAPQVAADLPESK